MNGNCKEIRLDKGGGLAWPNAQTESANMGDC